MGLYLAPAVFCYLLAGVLRTRGVGLAASRFCALGAVTSLTFAACWAPFLASATPYDSTLAVLRRVFPTSRSLYEDKAARPYMYDICAAAAGGHAAGLVRDASVTPPRQGCQRVVHDGAAASPQAQGRPARPHPLSTPHACGRHAPHTCRPSSRSRRCCGSRSDARSPHSSRPARCCCARPRAALSCSARRRAASPSSSSPSRRRRDAAEMRPRCGRDAAEVLPRCGRGVAEMRPRCCRGEAFR